MAAHILLFYSYFQIIIYSFNHRFDMISIDAFR